MASTTTQAFEVGTLVQVAPSTVLLERNIRDAQPDADLIKSIKDLGVLVPLVAVTTNDGALLIRQGHRRTLAAIEAKTETIPVYVAGTDSEADEAEVARIIAQRDENTHRAGLSTAEEVGVVEQLAAFGLSPAQIAKKARIKRDQVDTALTVSGSELARKASEKYEALTLDQAAVVAEFEDDAETVKALIAASTTGQFEHAAQRARDDRDEAQARAAVLDALNAEGVTVIDRPGYEDEKRILRLDRLVTSDDRDTRKDLSPTDHAECPGHVAWIGSDWFDVDADGNPIVFPDEPDEDADDEVWEAHDTECTRIRREARRVTRPTAIYGCDGWRKHGHHDRYDHGSSSKPKADDMSDKEREAAKAQRKLVVENNKAWSAAETVRRDWLATFAKAKTPPKGTARFIATAMSRDGHLVGDVDGNRLASQWLDKEHHGYGRADLSPTKTATDNRCLVLALLQVLGCYEAATSKDTWRQNGTDNAAGRYLRFLQAAGYTLSPVEKYAISSKTA